MKTHVYEVKMSKLNTATKTISFDKAFSKTVIVEALDVDSAIDKAKSYVSRLTGHKLYLLYVSLYNVKEVTASNPHVDVNQPRPYCYALSKNKMFSANELVLMLGGFANAARNTRFKTDGSIVFEVFNGGKWIEKTIRSNCYEAKIGMKFMNVIDVEDGQVAVMELA